jgi:pimeloyl-ACP methyl ester carboxylesterase
MRILSPTRASAAFLGVVALLLVCPSCAWYAPAAGDRASIRSGSPGQLTPWPGRATNRLEEIVQLAPRMFSIRVHHEELVNGRLVAAPKTLPADMAEYSRIYGRGIIRTYHHSPEDGEPVGRTVSTGMRFYSGVEVPRDDTPSPSDVASAEGTARKPWIVNLRGTWMRLDEPISGPARGLIVHLTSYGGYQYERPILHELRGRGWAVLWVDSSTVRPETMQIDVDPRNLRPAARQIATHIDDRLAEIAYAVEGGLEFIARERPHIPLSPVVVTAYSAGALAAPAVVALMPQRIDAAVLVGGGANLLDIAQRSTLTDGGLKLAWMHGPPSATDRQRLLDAYLQASRLDPYWTSLFLRDKPVLMMHAVFDRIVPAGNGELLYQRLGRPARVNFMLGHGLLFYRLPTQTKVIADWVDSAAANRSERRLVESSGQ